jgi:glycosyltransferase involved in cell wall biosynthesis
VAEELRSFRPDIVHAHGWSSFSAARGIGEEGIPLVTTLHDYGLLCPMKSLLRDERPCVHTAGLPCLRCPGSEQGLAKRAALALALRAGRRRSEHPVTYIAVSDHVARRHRRAGIAPDPIVIPNFIDVVDDDPQPVPADGPLLFVGSEAPNKGLETALDAFARFGPAGPRLVVVGDIGRPRHVPSVSYQGRRSGHDLWTLYRSCAAVLVPSMWDEPCPTVALEAMAFGRPLLASRVGGLTEIVEEGVNGMLVPPGDARALSEATVTLLSDPDRLGAMGAAARRRVDDFSAARIVPRIIEVYTQLVGADHR